MTHILWYVFDYIREQKFLHLEDWHATGKSAKVINNKYMSDDAMAVVRGKKEGKRSREHGLGSILERFLF